MDLFSGLEQFGIQADGKGIQLFEDGKSEESQEKEVKRETQKQEVLESSLIYTKKIRCTVCEKVFDTKIVKNARLKRMTPDFDLRPRFETIDTIKYDVHSCPFCGYSAMSRYFEHLTQGQINLVKEQISAMFQGGKEEPETFTYEEAIGRYKLALYCSVVKRSSASEKAYTCLKISWLYRDMQMKIADDGRDSEQKKEYLACEERFYQEAYEGLQKAIANESYPICGMDMYTLDYLLASMACHYQEFTKASKLISNILLSRTADRRIKDRALDMKDMILKHLRK